MDVKTISHYEIIETLGEGGMGVVSLARDKRLGRQVALKLMRADRVTCCGEEKERFLQEARTASSLNHPNIVTIYDIESVDGVDLISMEFVKGSTLDRLIGRKPLPLAVVLKNAAQIAQALEAAHAAGIVHRDIKPANIMVSESGLVKVLDFGLAKLGQEQGRAGANSLTAAPNDRSPRTEPGVLLGTVYYMAPEQAAGKEVDARADIFSFGCVLYEMLTGRRAFTGESNAAVLTAILRDEPKPVRDLAPGVPSELERILSRCLRKDPARRFQHASDLRVALEEIRDEFESGQLGPATGHPTQPAAASRNRRAIWPFAVFALAVMAAVGTVWWKWLQPAAPQKPTLTRLTSDPGLTSFPTLSPDGSLLAYASDRAGEGNLDIWVQQVAGGEPIPLTKAAVDEYEPVFSPDGSRIAFRSERDGGGIYIVSALGGEPRLLARHGRSPAFSPDGAEVVFAVGSPGVGATFSFGASSLYIVSANGGQPRRIAPDFAVAHHPVWAPDGKSILFEGNRELGPPNFDLWVVPMDGSPVVSTGLFKALRQEGFRLGPYPFALRGDSLVLSMSTGDSVNLYRVRLTPSTYTLNGHPEQLTFGTGLERLPALSRDGQMVFAAGLENTDLWETPVDANKGVVKGQPRQLTKDTSEDYYPHVSADGAKVAFISRRGGSDDVWLLDAATGKQTSVLTTPARELYPKLSADGSMVAFGSIDNNKRGVLIMPTAGGFANKLCDDCGLVRDVTRDGKKILLQVGPPPHVSLLDVETRQVSVLLQHEGQPLYAPKFSADDRWIAFQAVEQPTTRTLYIAPFRSGQPVPKSEWVKVTDGSYMDRNSNWSPDGTLLYFLSERDSFRCIWAQRLVPATKQPTGEPFAVAHFHNAVRSLMNIDGPGQVGITVAPDRIIYSIGDLTGNIWMTRLP